MLRGERVVLRPVEERDVDALARWRNDPQVINFLFSPFFVKPGGQKAWHASLLSNPDKVMFMCDDLRGVSIGALGVDRIDWWNQECELGPFFFDPESHPPDTAKMRSRGYRTSQGRVAGTNPVAVGRRRRLSAGRRATRRPLAQVPGSPGRHPGGPA